MRVAVITVILLFGKKKIYQKNVNTSRDVLEKLKIKKNETHTKYLCDSVKITCSHISTESEDISQKLFCKLYHFQHIHTNVIETKFKGLNKSSLNIFIPPCIIY